MEQNLELIRRTEAFLRESFQNSSVQESDPAACAYRVEHAFRVAHIGKEIALKEGFDPTEMIIACLLHDIAYIQPLDTREAQQNHGRLSAQIARPFLAELGLSDDRIREICYGIAIHVDGKADFEGETTAFAETISDADNIDRFDAYRIYETLHFGGFQKLPLPDKLSEVEASLQGLQKLKKLPLATKTAEALWQERIAFYISFYERLKRQFHHSREIILE